MVFSNSIEENFIEEKIITKLIPKLVRLLSNFFGFKRDVKNIITISQSFQSIFKGMFPMGQLYMIINMG